jgi:hypothetical protein
MAKKQESPDKFSEKLLAKLNILDDRILNIWLDEKSHLNDDEKWDIFATLLESRVSLLKLLRESGVRLGAEVCVPGWLERLSSSRLEVKKRDIRKMEMERRSRKNVATYQAISEIMDGEI